VLAAGLRLISIELGAIQRHEASPSGTALEASKHSPTAAKAKAWSAAAAELCYSRMNRIVRCDCCSRATSTPRNGTVCPLVDPVDEIDAEGYAVVYRQINPATNSVRHIPGPTPFPAGRLSNGRRRIQTAKPRRNMEYLLQLMRMELYLDTCPKTRNCRRSAVIIFPFFLISGIYVRSCWDGFCLAGSVK